MKKVSLFLGLTICYLASFSQQQGTFRDPRDKKTYMTITIGTQTWFAENLAFQPTSGNYWAYNNNQSNIAKYGYLYDWETAKTVCPSGWHLPSDAEWTALTDYLGGESVAGGEIKATTDWTYDANGNATNESGFNALPAGFRYSNGSSSRVGRCASFWSSTPLDSENAWYRSLNYNNGKVIRYYGNHATGSSVRCIKD